VPCIGLDLSERVIGSIGRTVVSLLAALNQLLLALALCRDKRVVLVPVCDFSCGELLVE